MSDIKRITLFEVKFVGRAVLKVLLQNWHYTEKDKCDVDPGPFLFPFQKHENEEDGASGNKDGNGREKKETDVAISFVFGQNIKDRAKVGCFPLVLHLFLTQ